MKNAYRLLYKAPIYDMLNDPDNIDTWRKVFYISKYDCPSELDLTTKIIELKNLYNMKDEYIAIQDLDEIKIDN